MSNEKDDKVKAAKDVVRDVIDVAISDTLEKFKGESLNLFSESARITLTSAIAAEVFSSLSPLIEDIVSENESLWFMLDEMKVSDVKNNPFIAEELNDVIDTNMTRIRFLMSQKGEA